MPKTANMNPKADRVYFNKVEKWQEELETLRTIILDCGLTEELKWEQPCYTFHNHNIVILGGLKESCVLSFFKGVLLNDAHGILVKSGENTRSGRVIRFTNVRDIIALESVLKAYIYEAIEVEKAGLTVDFEKNAKLIFPEEFQNKLDGNPRLENCF